MPTLEQFHDEEYAMEDEDFWLERPQRIAVPPMVIWGAIGLVALSVTVAAVATLLLPEQLNPILRSQSQPTTDELAQFDEKTDSREEARSQTPDTANLPPEPPTQDSVTPGALPDDATQTSSTTSAIVSDAAIVALETPAPAENGVPIQTIVLITTGCGLLSGGVTLALRAWLRRDMTVSLPQPKVPNFQWRQHRNTRQRSRSDSPASSPEVAPQTQPNVMVLPPEAVTPLDQFADDERGDLAAQLDIRRRYSLSSLMEEDLDYRYPLIAQPMLKSVWQWLQGLFRRLFGQVSPHKAAASTTPKNAIAPMDAAGYEYLWAQLLEGAANGWDRHRMAKFFTQVEDRCTPAEWFSWLERFGQKVMTSPKPNLELANRLELVATHVQYLPDYHKVALHANYICHELRKRATSDVVWEYDGPDH